MALSFIATLNQPSLNRAFFLGIQPRCSSAVWERFCRGSLKHLVVVTINGNIENCAGSQFDPELAEKFVEIMKD